MAKKLKGQEMVFELVLIFSISLVLITVLYSIFNSYQNYYSSSGAGNSLGKVKSLVELNVIQMAEKEANGSVIVKIPDRVLNEVYIVELSAGGLNVSSKGVSRATNLYGLQDSFAFSGRVPSVNGRLTIYKTGNQIIIQ